MSEASSEVGFLEEAESLRASLRASSSRLGLPLSWVHETQSTNDDAVQAASAGAAHGALFVAERQHAGRGRGGHRWESCAGEHLTFSLLLRELPPAECLPLMTLVVGLALRDAICAHTHLDPRLKWPNDVYLQGRKVAGILVESRVQGGQHRLVVVGVGLDVNGGGFAGELADKATTLQREHGAPLSRVALLGAFLAAFARRLDGMSTLERTLEQLSEWRRVDALLDQSLVVGGVEGVGAGLDDSGALLVRTAEGVVPVVAGSVEFR